MACHRCSGTSYSDRFRLAPIVLDSLVEFLEGVCVIWVLLLRVVVSILAGVHWPLFLPVAGEPYLLVMLLEAACSLFSDQMAVPYFKVVLPALQELLFQSSQATLACSGELQWPMLRFTTAFGS